MLQECREHGYFRGENCPVCNTEGRFLMNELEIDRVGRMMAGILRHFPEKYELNMDPQGWLSVTDMVRAVKNKDRRFRWLKTHHIFAIVETDGKGRYQIRSDNIRATYGHSLPLELDLPTDNIPELLYYPTTIEEVEMMLETGIRPSDRSMVHLSSTFDKALTAGLHRVARPIILEIDAEAAVQAGAVIMKACDSVYLTKEILPEHLKKMDMEYEDEEAPVGESDVSDVPTEAAPKAKKTKKASVEDADVPVEAAPKAKKTKKASGEEVSEEIESSDNAESASEESSVEETVKKPAKKKTKQQS